MLIQSSAMVRPGTQCGLRMKPAVQALALSLSSDELPPVVPSTEALTTLDLKPARGTPSWLNTLAQLAARLALPPMKFPSQGSCANDCVLVVGRNNSSIEGARTEWVTLPRNWRSGTGVYFRPSVKTSAEPARLLEILR